MTIPELEGMRRPLWRRQIPALWRDATTVQFGDDVVVDRMSESHLRWLRCLDGTRTPDEAYGLLAIPLDEACRVVRALAAAGGLIDAAVVPSSLRFGGHREREVALSRWEAALDQHRDDTIALRAMEARDGVRVAIVGEGAVRDALAAALDDAGLTEVATTAAATCVVLANAPHPEVPPLSDAAALDLPHLPVGVRSDRAVVGPLVVPGRSGCLACAHLHRRDADRHWPLLAVQWSQASSAPSSADPLIVRLAAGHAIHMLRTWVDDIDGVGEWRDRAIEVRQGELVGRALSRPPHPLCGCRWAVA